MPKKERAIDDPNSPIRVLGRVLKNGVAPVLGGVMSTAATGLPGPGSTVGSVIANTVGEVVRKKLGIEGPTTDADVEKALAEADPEVIAYIKETEAQVDLKKLDVTLAEIASHDNSISEVNETMRAEAMASMHGGPASTWRPKWGHHGFWVWLAVQAVLMVGLLVVILRDPTQLGIIGILVGALTGNLGGLYAILGIYAKGRSVEKASLNSQLGAALGMLKGGSQG